MFITRLFRNSMIVILSVVGLAACVFGLMYVQGPSSSPKTSVQKDSLIVAPPLVSNEVFVPMPAGFLEYARSLIGTPYLYASSNPAAGFDCSGFISHVFNHFNMSVPRSSVDFTNYGREIPLDMALPGDLILFTGTDSSIRIVGHMGIVEKRENEALWFIHSTSGKAYGVTITQLNPYYMGRFVKTIRVFNLP